MTTKRKTDRNKRVHELPAGKYYVGDPCYVIREGWDDYLDAWYKGQPWRGRPTTAYNTRGDGRFRDNFGREYPVDAGIIAAVPLEHIQDMNRARLDGAVIRFTNPFRCSMNDRGRIKIGDIIINTAGRA